MPKMVTDFESSIALAQAAQVLRAAPAVSISLSQVAQALQAAPTAAFAAYMAAMNTNGAAVDSGTAASLYIAGKLTSATISGQRQTLRWLANWAFIGVIDGYCTHSWYHVVENTYQDLNLHLDHIPETLLLTGISSAIYTPLYCATFLGLLSLVEGKGISGATQRINADFRELIVHSTKIWAPINMILFGLVALELRTLACMGFHYVFLVGLALWDTAATAATAATAEKAAVPAGEEVFLNDPVLVFAGDGMERAIEMPQNTIAESIQEEVVLVAQVFAEVVGDAVEDLRNLQVDDIKEALSDASEAVSDAVSDVVTEIQKTTAEDVKEYADDLAESVTNAVEDVQDIVTDVFAERIDFSVLSVYMAPEEPVKVDDDEPEPAAAVVEEEKVK